MLGKESLLEKRVLKMLVLEKRSDDKQGTAEQNQEGYCYVRTARRHRYPSSLSPRCCFTWSSRSPPVQKAGQLYRHTSVYRNSLKKYVEFYGELLSLLPLSETTFHFSSYQASQYRKAVPS